MLMTLLSGVGGLVGLIIIAGGVGELLHNIFFARQLFEGFGFMTVPVVVPVFGVAVGLMSTRFSLQAAVLLILNSLVYFASVFLTGQKVRAVLFVIVVTIVVAMRWRVQWRYVALVGVLFVPMSMWYHYNIRQELSLGSAEAEIDITSFNSAISSTWGPFSASGADILRTLGVANLDRDLIAFSPGTIAAAPATVIPRAIWPEKPVGSSVAFSEAFFPEKWAVGTGVPPSWAAELLWLLGLVVGLGVYGATAFAIEWTDRRWKRHGTFGWSVLARSWLGVLVVILLKAGSGSALRTGTIYGLAAVLVAIAVLSVEANRSVVVKGARIDMPA
jgi:hypothetical protein